jgi:hypothetical protein
MPKEREPRRIISLNPREPKTADFGFTLREKAHPVTGEPDTIKYLREQLRGLRGKDITVKLYGGSVHRGKVVQRFRGLERSLTLNTYRDIFGPGGAYESMLYEGYRAIYDPAEAEGESIVVSRIEIEVD